MDNSKERLVWLDIETTGLDQQNNMQGIFENKILEIGLHITDSNFNIIDNGFEVVVHQNEQNLEKMRPMIQEMHQNSGLLEKVKKSPFSLETAEKMVIDYLKDQGVKPEEAPMCGNNIKFDRNFIAAQMPTLNSYFHYRNLDVSSLKETFKRTHPDVVEQVDKKMTHRGLDDIKESINELKHYQDNIFPSPEKPKKTYNNRP